MKDETGTRDQGQGTRYEEQGTRDKEKKMRNEDSGESSLRGNITFS